jgi:tRNA A37 threonylcarbamoyladenosine synthetase subunit TsaC/SUA5/YrdC
MTTSVFERHSDTDITNPESLAMTFDSEVAVTIDGGDTLTTPSTVVDLTDSSAPVVVRQGAGSFEE